MGVNCSVQLNQGANWRKVGEVASILLGASKNRSKLGRDGWHIVVAGFEYGVSKPTFQPEYIDVIISGDKSNPVCRAIEKTDGFPYPLWYGMEGRTLYPKATAAKIALAEAIAKFFGGKIIYNDCTEQKRKFKTLVDFTGEDDAAFYRYQNALEALKPLTTDDIQRCEKYAAY